MFEEKGMPGWKALGFKSYNEYLESDLWRDKRKWIIECFENECQKCGSNKKLIVHHLNYFNIGNEGIDDVTVICWDCHKKEHKEELENDEHRNR